MAQTQFTPEMVYNLVANSPQGRLVVEQLARARELQQQAEQMAPVIQQFAQNPMQGIQQIGDWAQGMTHQSQPMQPINQYQGQPLAQQMQPTNQQQGNIEQQGGAPMNNPGGMMGMAMGYINNFENSFKEILESLKIVNETVVTLTNDNKTLIEDNKALIAELAAARADIGKLL